MALLNRTGDPVFANCVSNGAAAEGGLRTSPAEEWQPMSGEGLLLEPSDEPDARFATAPLIAINFPAFNDGRALSLAVLLRTRYQYAGELRAVGDVHPDMVHYMKRCGFDTFLMPEGRTLPVTAGDSHITLAPYSDYYQASVLDPEPAFRRVRRGA